MSTSPVLRSKVTPQNSLSAFRCKAWISPQIRSCFSEVFIVLGCFFCFFQTCRNLGMTLFDCDSQVKCEVVSCLSSSLLDDSLAPKKVKNIGFPFHTHGGIKK